MAMETVQFTCAHCGTDVYFRESADAKKLIAKGKCVAGSHDACPDCEWSRHVVYGTDSLPPCGEMMEPARFLEVPARHPSGEVFNVPMVERRCQGCGWETRSPIQRQLTAIPDTNTFDLVRLGKDGDGKIMDSEFADRKYMTF